MIGFKGLLRQFNVSCVVCGEPLFRVRPAFGKSRHLVGDDSSACLCCMDVAGSQTDYVDMGSGIRMIVHYVHKRLKLWTICYSDVSIVVRHGSRFCATTACTI
jgi:hypothetical protein